MSSRPFNSRFVSSRSSQNPRHSTANGYRTSSRYATRRLTPFQRRVTGVLKNNTLLGVPNPAIDVVFDAFPVVNSINNNLITDYSQANQILFTSALTPLALVQLSNRFLINAVQNNGQTQVLNMAPWFVAATSYARWKCNGVTFTIDNQLPASSSGSIGCFIINDPSYQPSSATVLSVFESLRGSSTNCIVIPPGGSGSLTFPSSGFLFNPIQRGMSRGQPPQMTSLGRIVCFMINPITNLSLVAQNIQFPILRSRLSGSFAFADPLSNIVGLESYQNQTSVYNPAYLASGPSYAFGPSIYSTPWNSNVAGQQDLKVSAWLDNPASNIDAEFPNAVTTINLTSIPTELVPAFQNACDKISSGGNQTSLVARDSSVEQIIEDYVPLPDAKWMRVTPNLGHHSSKFFIPMLIGAIGALVPMARAAYDAYKKSGGSILTTLKTMFGNAPANIGGSPPNNAYVNFNPFLSQPPSIHPSNTPAFPGAPYSWSQFGMPQVLQTDPSISSRPFNGGLIQNGSPLYNRMIQQLINTANISSGNVNKFDQQTAALNKSGQAWALNWFSSPTTAVNLGSGTSGLWEQNNNGAPTSELIGFGQPQNQAINPNNPFYSDPFGRTAQTGSALVKDSSLAIFDPTASLLSEPISFLFTLTNYQAEDQWLQIHLWRSLGHSSTVAYNFVPVLLNDPTLQSLLRSVTCVSTPLGDHPTTANQILFDGHVTVFPTPFLLTEPAAGVPIATLPLDHFTSCETLAVQRFQLPFAADDLGSAATTVYQKRAAGNSGFHCFDCDFQNLYYSDSADVDVLKNGVSVSNWRQIVPPYDEDVDAPNTILCRFVGYPRYTRIPY